MTLSANGQQQVGGDGSVCVVVTGDVKDKNGKHIGDLYEIELTAVQAWTALLAEFGILLAAPTAV